MNIRLLPLFTALLFTSCEKETELERIKREASQGDPEAQLGLAIIYDTVDGLPEYKADAVKWCRMAAEQGHAGAQYYLEEVPEVKESQVELLKEEDEDIY